MKTRLLYRYCVVVLLAGAASAFAASVRYKTASIDEAGQIHILTTAAKEIVPPKFKDQVAFTQQSISPNSKIVGWLELYPYPQPPEITYVPDPIPQCLVLYQNGRALHRFRTDQIFWDWHFWSGGTQVAYVTGPTHGGGGQAILRDVASGRILQRWYPPNTDSPETSPPVWVKGLRY